VSTRKFHEIWVEQCNATHEINLRYGVKAAFDYLVAEKLLNFANAATSRPEFARELPRFVAYVRGLFTPQEMRTHLARIERQQTEYAAENNDEGDDEFDDDDELIRESPGLSLPTAPPAPPRTPAGKSPASGGGRAKSRETRTLRWREMDSNFRFRGNRYRKRSGTPRSTATRRGSRGYTSGK
jgi:hypothetical protein